jgi:uncharacterized protein (DUF1501 family)
MFEKGLGISRRDFMNLSAAGIGGASLSGWLPILASRAAQQGQNNHKRCVLLWMDGGPSHKDTFDLKPNTQHGGPYRPINTSVNGLQISEHFPQLAQKMNLGAVIRSMSTGEGAHGRAKYFLHTGYREGVGGLVYPSLGSIAAMEIGNPNSALPNYVVVGNRAYGSGFLGAAHQPLMVLDPNRGVENLTPGVANNQFENRVGLLQELEAGFNKTYGPGMGNAHQTTYNLAVTLVQDEGTRAFDLSQETAATRQRYGGTRFGDGCLLARRLIEAGVTFVEVTLGGWDTHTNNFQRVQQLSAQVDPAASALITDLRDRGLLDDTLIIWMGDFGRTPNINSRPPTPGRDHYPRAWSSALWGCGLNGQVVGRTDANGATVTERPVPTIDFMATVCTLLGIDYTRMNQTHIGRPVRIVDRGANPITQLCGTPANAANG